MLRKHRTHDLPRECIQVQPIARRVKVRVQNEESALSWKKVLDGDPINWTAENRAFTASPVPKAGDNFAVCVPKSIAVLAGETGTAPNSQHCRDNTSIKNGYCAILLRLGF